MKIGPKKAGNSDDIIKLICLEQFGISREVFINWIKPYFSLMHWDFYDVRKAQIDQLSRLLPEHKGSKELVDYYLGLTKLQSLDHVIRKITPTDKQSLLAIQPWRRRAIAGFLVKKNNAGDWDIFEEPLQKFKQKSLLNNGWDYRAFPRQFDAIDKKITTHPLYQNLLIGVINLVYGINKTITQLLIKTHHIQVVVGQNNQGLCVPEGIHKDGSDYIISALVIERENIIGGESYIYRKDKRTIAFHHCLQPGEGLFQEDEKSSLWHTATPIFSADKKMMEGNGIRSIIGFDIDVINN